MQKTKNAIMPASSSQDALKALDACASEPIHIPGTVQTFGCLLAANASDRQIVHASLNCQDFIGKTADALLGSDLSAALGRAIGHAFQNALAQGDLEMRSTILGDFEINNKSCTIHVSQKDGLILFEFEAARPGELSDVGALKQLNFLTRAIDDCTSEQALFDITAKLLRHLSGFDRVMVSRFDRDFNGEVLSEDKQASMPSFLGLRFPHWDIPPQARKMMELLPLRLINDVDQVPVGLVSHDPDAPQPDISLAVTRGVSSVHMHYLRNMGSAATMTLSIKLEGRLWGIMSFHHRRPRVVSAQLRDLMVSLGRMFSAKLQVLMQKSHLEMVSRVDGYKDKIMSDLTTPADFDKFGQMVLDVFDANGFVVVQDGQERSFGAIPEISVRNALEETMTASTWLRPIENLSDTLPDLRQDLNGCAGALVVAPDTDRILFIFRPEVEQTLTWAGNPTKTIEPHDGQFRLTPRGSFSAYLETVRGRSKPWSDEDMYFAECVWSLVNSLDRTELINALNRQQKIMIDELNHRVRNILALIRSVSQQARSSSYGSLDTYSRTLESRIEALAASHDIASGSLASSVPVRDLIHREFHPYVSDTSSRLTIGGISLDIRPDVAPIFSLVIHELVTNAVKYGALSNDTGIITLNFSEQEDCMVLHWKEEGGPPVQDPKTLGFGSTLIKQAIPFELNGEVELRFDPGGVTARILLPATAFERATKIIRPRSRIEMAPVSDNELKVMTETASCLVVEDNFIIGMACHDQVLAFGFESCEVASNVESALDHIDATPPDFAILDINLGNKMTSFPIAEALSAKGIPFVFITGYGDNHGLPDVFQSSLKLTKPVANAALRSAIGTALKHNQGEAL